MKNILILIVTLAFFSACNNNQKNQTSLPQATSEIEYITVDSFLVVAADFVGKEITVKGTVDHICKHGGKRVKIFGENPDNTLHGEASESTGAFNAELEGSEVCLTGIVAESKMDLAYVEEYEKNLLEAIEKNKEEVDMEHAKGVDHHAKLDEIKAWKEEIATNGKGYISSYYLDVTSYQEITDKAAGKCCGSAPEAAVDSSTSTTAPCGSKEKAPCESSAEAKPCGGSH
ncbi:MAG: hypothetical protein CVU09_10595 [Bacteroidetes bacterium HGW-Bacteroidetes-4]|jgi:hypothetical protein|nr:MAG: hypothetical protein CVU09_10595 [Bacteroidetes bacterium HGW-Bacteroidetes-4]